MSLDVYLKSEPREESCMCPHCDHKHTRTVSETFFESNITHNLTKMADAAGLYVPLWRPEEQQLTTAGLLVPVLTFGLDTLRKDPDKFRKFNPENGWGSYEGLIRFVENYLKACQENPLARVEVSR